MATTLNNLESSVSNQEFTRNGQDKIYFERIGSYSIEWNDSTSVSSQVEIVDKYMSLDQVNSFFNSKDENYVKSAPKSILKGSHHCDVIDVNTGEKLVQFSTDSSLNNQESSRKSNLNLVQNESKTEDVNSGSHLNHTVSKNPKKSFEREEKSSDGALTSFRKFNRTELPLIEEESREIDNNFRYPYNLSERESSEPLVTDRTSETETEKFEPTYEDENFAHSLLAKQEKPKKKRDITSLQRAITMKLNNLSSKSLKPVKSLKKKIKLTKRGRNYKNRVEAEEKNLIREPKIINDEPDLETASSSEDDQSTYRSIAFKESGQCVETTHSRPIKLNKGETPRKSEEPEESEKQKESEESEKQKKSEKSEKQKESEESEESEKQKKSEKQKESEESEKPEKCDDLKSQTDFSTLIKITTIESVDSDYSGDEDYDIEISTSRSMRSAFSHDSAYYKWSREKHSKLEEEEIETESLTTLFRSLILEGIRNPELILKGMRKDLSCDVDNMCTSEFDGPEDDSITLEEYG